jgi:hypothetical protein
VWRHGTRRPAATSCHMMWFTMDRHTLTHAGCYVSAAAWLPAEEHPPSRPASTIMSVATNEPTMSSKLPNLEKKSRPASTMASRAARGLGETLKALWVRVWDARMASRAPVTAVPTGISMRTHACDAQYLMSKRALFCVLCPLGAVAQHAAVIRCTGMEGKTQVQALECLYPRSQWSQGYLIFSEWPEKQLRRWLLCTTLRQCQQCLRIHACHNDARLHLHNTCSTELHNCTSSHATHSIQCVF